jgi:hypothetical protein
VKVKSDTNAYCVKDYPGFLKNRRGISPKVNVDKFFCFEVSKNEEKGAVVSEE